MVLWEPPVFEGRSPVNGYYLDIKEASAGEEGWKAVHEKVNKMKYMKVRQMAVVSLSMYELSHPLTPPGPFQVTGLKTGMSYVFRVRAQNIAGVGKASPVLGPIVAQTRPGECISHIQLPHSSSRKIR